VGWLNLLGAVTELCLLPAQGQEPQALEITGTVEGYYSFNFNRPTGAPGPGGVPVENTLRNFDFADNEFDLSLIEIVLQRPTTDRQVGFRLDLDFGPTTDWVHAGEPTGGETWKHVQQAFITVPLKGGHKLDVGKFVTHHGAEVIESRDNLNYTRSFLFAWAIPYYHTGVRYWRSLNEAQSRYVCLYLYNGWNNVQDNNDEKSLGVMYGTSLGGRSSLILNYTGGGEATAPGPSGLRHLLDTVWTHPANDRVTYVLNVDWVQQKDATAAGSATWYGGAAYAKYALSPHHALAGRLEYFKDADGFATGNTQDLKELTLTYETEHPHTLLTRLELRHDWSNRAVFTDDNGTRTSQTTLLVGWTYSF